MSTLRDLIVRHPDAFYRQSWYKGHGETFMDTPGLDQMGPPTGIRRPGFVPTPGNPDLPLAATLAAASLAHPGAPVWRFFHWCQDVDRHGNAVYVGGIGHDEAPGFQIHRYMKPDLRWGLSKW